MRGESATDQWTSDGSDTHNGAHQTLQRGSLGQWNSMNYAHDLDVHISVGLLSSLGDGIEVGRRLTLPAIMPAAPTPANARPTMKAIEFGAAPQIEEATSKRITLARRTGFVGKKAYSLPKRSWKQQLVRVYALPYQPTSDKALNSLLMLGIA
jgi:hypothetical protein